MKEITREIIQAQIKDGWGNFVVNFKRLSPGEQRAFLDRQGYAALSGLLGHVLAWWELGKYTMEQILIEPDFKNSDIDVDFFNTQAVERFSSYNDAEIVEEFEKMRLTMLEFVNQLPDKAFLNKRINERLYVEFIDHFEEHQ
ncbi:MAG: hypothetical protein AB9891_07025 [Anaerolineaceae bacterium]